MRFYAQRLSELSASLKPAAREIAVFSTARMTVVSSPQQSKDLVASRQPAIVIAGSGMATGGRVIHHLEATLSSPKNTVLFVGYHAAGTRGRQLVDGATQVRLKGRDIPVAARIEQIEILRWLSGFASPPAMTYLVHGESNALEALARRIEQTLHWPIHIAAYLERVELPAIN